MGSTDSVEASNTNLVHVHVHVEAAPGVASTDAPAASISTMEPSKRGLTEPVDPVDPATEMPVPAAAVDPAAVPAPGADSQAASAVSAGVVSPTSVAGGDPAALATAADPAASEAGR